MTNAEIIASLHEIVDRLDAVLEPARKMGGLPLIKVTIGPRGDEPAFRLVVGVEPADDDKEDEA